MSELSELKVGVIGLGNMGKHHVRNYAEIEGAKLTAIVDVNQEILDAFSQKYNVNGYTSLTEMLEKEDLDAVTITAPTRLHHAIAKEVIEAGVNLLVEKPIADEVAKAQELVALAKAKDLTLMVGHIERFNPAVSKLKELIDAGALGKVTSIIAKRVGVFPAQIKDANVIIDLAVHDIDIFSYLLDKQPDRIHGNAGRALIDGREDYAELFLTYGDQNCFIQVNWITPIRIRNLAITGTKGYAELNYMTQELVMYESNYQKDIDNSGEDNIKFGEPKTHTIDVEKKEPLKEELLHFLDCIRHKKTPLITGETGQNALDIALQVMSQMNMK